MLVTRRSLEAEQAENAQLAEQLGYYEEMLPFLALAKEVKRATIRALETHDQLTAAQIGEYAFRLVLDQQIETARDELVATYEQAHRQALYQRLLREVEATEGPQIFAEVQQRIEADPQLALELRDSARRELAARARDVVRQQVTAEQQDIINKEAVRQLELDRLDVELLAERELDLSRDDVSRLILPGDQLEILGEGQSSGAQGLKLEWKRDAWGNEGWIVAADCPGLWSANGGRLGVDQSRFVVVASKCGDYKTGKRHVVENLLMIGEQVVLTQGDEAKILQPHVYINDPSQRGTKLSPIVLRATDLRTKAIEFDEA